jgi:hypothetical protein
MGTHTKRLPSRTLLFSSGGLALGSITAASDHLVGTASAAALASPFGQPRNGFGLLTYPWRAKVGCRATPPVSERFAFTERRAAGDHTSAIRGQRNRNLNRRASCFLCTQAMPSTTA